MERRERRRDERGKDEVNTILFNFYSEIQNTEIIFLLGCHYFFHCISLLAPLSPLRCSLNSVISITSNIFPSSAFSISFIVTCSSTCLFLSVPLCDALGMDNLSLFCLLLLFKTDFRYEEVINFLLFYFYFFLSLCLTVGSNDYRTINLPKVFGPGTVSYICTSPFVSSAPLLIFSMCYSQACPFHHPVLWSEAGAEDSITGLCLCFSPDPCIHMISLQNIRLSADKQSRFLIFSPPAFWPSLILDHF